MCCGRVFLTEAPPAAITLCALIAVALTVIARCQSSPQVVLPFTGLGDAEGVAVDSAGDLYVTGSNRVLKLPAGSASQEVVPFSGLTSSAGVAVDSAGNLYVTDSSDDRVLKLPTGSSTQTVLPFTGLNHPSVPRWIPPATSKSPTLATTGC